MVFTHDTEVALTAAAALVNTASSDGEHLPDVAALKEFFHAYAWSGRLEHTQTELRAVQALRPRLRRLWEASEEEAVALVNQLLREYVALPQLVRHDDWPYHLHATPSDAPLAARMAVEAAMAMVDVIRSGELHRLRVCEYPSCGDVLIDLSKNRSKRFCDLSCGNKAAVSAYRARKSAGA